MAYDYLRSRPSKGTGNTPIFDRLGYKFKDVVSLPIDHLDISPAILDLLKAAKTVREEDRKVVPQFSTLEDLINYGYVNLERWAEQQPISLNSLDIMYSIELALARFALKLRGTKFTVFDIKIDDLSLTPETKNVLKKYMQNRTLGDIYSMGSVKVRDLFANDDKAYKSVLKAMMEFGTSPETIYPSDLVDDFGDTPIIDTPPIYFDGTKHTVVDQTFLFRAIKNAFAREAERQKRNTEMQSSSPEQPVKKPEIKYTVIPTAPPTYSSTYPQMPNTSLPSKPAPAESAQKAEEAQPQPKELTEAEKQAIQRYENMMSKVKFVGKFDYSKLIKLIAEKFESIDDFLKEVHLSSGVLQSIYNGKELKERTLLIISSILDCEIEDLVSLNSNRGAQATAEAEQRPEYIASENATRSGRTVHVGESVPKDMPQSELLNKPIEKLGIKWNYVQAVKYTFPDISTIGDLIKYSQKELVEAGITYHVARCIVDSLKFYGLTLKGAKATPGRKSKVNVTAVKVKPVHSQKLQGETAEDSKTSGQAPGASTESNLTSPFDKDKRKNYYSTPRGYIKVLGERMKKYNPYPENTGFDSQM